MRLRYGNGKATDGVSIELTGDEVATAIDAWLTAHRVHISGPRTVRVNGELCESGRVYVDPSGSVIYQGKRWQGRPSKIRIRMMDQCVGRSCGGLLIGVESQESDGAIRYCSSCGRAHTFETNGEWWRWRIERKPRKKS